MCCVSKLLLTGLHEMNMTQESCFPNPLLYSSSTPKRPWQILFHPQSEEECPAGWSSRSPGSPTHIKAHQTLTPQGWRTRASKTECSTSKSYLNPSSFAEFFFKWSTSPDLSPLLCFPGIGTEPSRAPWGNTTLCQLPKPSCLPRDRLTGEVGWRAWSFPWIRMPCLPKAYLLALEWRLFCFPLLI